MNMSFWQTLKRYMYCTAGQKLLMRKNNLRDFRNGDRRAWEEKEKMVVLVITEEKKSKTEMTASVQENKWAKDEINVPIALSAFRDKTNGRRRREEEEEDVD